MKLMMREYCKIINDVFCNKENIAVYSINELIDTAIFISEDGDNGRAIKLCEMTIEYYLPKFETEPNVFGEDVITLYLHHGAFLELLGFSEVASSSFAKALQTAEQLKEFLNENDSAKYIALCYHFMASHYMNAKDYKSAVGCYWLICKLLEKRLVDKENNLLFNKAKMNLEIISGI